MELKKYNLAGTNVTLEEYELVNFIAGFRTLHPDVADSLSKTESQKTAAKGLKYVVQNKLDDAADVFCEVLMEKDSLELLWKFFPNFYHSSISYNWDKLQKYIDIRESSDNKVSGHSSPSFYKNKPEFKIDFEVDSVVIPIKISNHIPLIKIKINGKYYYFLIDTGCNKTLIGKNIITPNNILYDSVETTIKTIDGMLPVYSGFLPELDFEGIKMSNIPIDVVDKDDAVKLKFLFITFFRCDGVIGWDLLHRFDFTIDYKNKLLTLRKPIEKNIQQKNLFWYETPIVKFYSENKLPLLFHLDSGSETTFFDLAKFSMLGLADTNNLKKRTMILYGADGNKIKNNKYEYPNFQCFTLSNNEMTHLSANKVSLLNREISSSYTLYLDGILGSGWFKNKAVRVDMKNGLFEIYE